MTQAVVHCYPVVVNLEQLDDDDRSTLAKFVYGPRNGLKIERIIARDGTLIIVLRKNKGDRLFLLPEIDGKGQVVYHYLGKIGSMDNHKYESHSLVQGYYQKMVLELEEKYKKMACDIVDLRKKMDDLIFGVEPKEATAPEEGPKLVEKRLYYYAGNYLHLSDMQEEALAKPGSFLLGPGGSGKTTVGVMGLYNLRQILADFELADNKLHNKFLYYMTLKAGLARDTERGWEDSLYDKKDGRVRFGSYEDVTLKLHEKILSRYQVEDLTETLEKAETNEERAKLMKTDVFYVSFNKKGTGTYWLKDIHGEIHQGNFRDLSPETIKNCRQELVDWARHNGHIAKERLSQVSKDEGFTAWYKNFVNNMGNKLRADLKIKDEDWKALKSAKNKKKEKKLLGNVPEVFLDSI